MNFFCTHSSIIALLLGACLPPVDQRVMLPNDINGAVVTINGWDIGCDNLGKCVAIAAVPQRKVPMNGIRGALRIELDHRDGLAAGLTVIPLDFEQRLPTVKPTLADAERILETLRDGDEFLIWVEDGLDKPYYVPGKGFAEVEKLYAQWLDKFPMRWSQQDAITPTRAVRLNNFRGPTLSVDQLAECEAPSKGRLQAAWDLSGQVRLFQYDCSAAGAFAADSLWFIQNRQSGELSAIGIEEATGPKTEGKAAGLHNAYFEESQGLLVTRKYGGSPDCGLSATYASTSSGFVLAERREARRCIGLFSGDWIRTYRSPAVILPEQW